MSKKEYISAHPQISTEIKTGNAIQKEKPTKQEKRIKTLNTTRLINYLMKSQTINPHIISQFQVSNFDHNYVVPHTVRVAPAYRGKSVLYLAVLRGSWGLVFSLLISQRLSPPKFSEKVNLILASAGEKKDPLQIQSQHIFLKMLLKKPGQFHTHLFKLHQQIKKKHDTKRTALSSRWFFQPRKNYAPTLAVLQKSMSILNSPEAMSNFEVHEQKHQHLQPDPSQNIPPPQPVPVKQTTPPPSAFGRISNWISSCIWKNNQKRPENPSGPQDICELK